MNGKNLHQIFRQYIDNFDYVNCTEHREYYKWQICEQFPALMQKALSVTPDNFVSALNDVRKCTCNIIDSYTQPMAGLVEMAKHNKGEDIEQVRQILKDLYTDDGGDLKVRAEIIANFISRCDELMNKHFPGSFRYKQNSHSVSSLLFLNDPDHHYMFKASHCQDFADCVEFYDSWGAGDSIKLDVFHRMCDELMDAIKGCPELLEIDASRFDGRLKLVGGPLHPDKEKHILAFDIIYCCSTYSLYSKVSYTKRNSKEKELYGAMRIKAEKLLHEYEEVVAENEKLQEALNYVSKAFVVGDTVNHAKFGKGTVKSIDGIYMVADYPEKEVRGSIPVMIANGLLKSGREEFAAQTEVYRNILKKYDSIPKRLDYAAKVLEPYTQYLE